MRIRPILLLTAALLCGSCYDSSFGRAEERPTDEAATVTIRHLCETVLDETVRITGDLVCTGIVTTSDREENFYRSLCIEQDGAAVEIMAGVDRLYNDYPIGCRVTVRLRGLALGRSRGVVQIGRYPTAGSGYATDYLASQPALDAAVTRHGTERVEVRPATLRYDQLTPESCGRLVRMDYLEFRPDDPELPATWSGNRLFTDTAGNEIRTYVRTYARFADRTITPGFYAITGILQRDDAGHYLLKPRDEADISPMH